MAYTEPFHICSAFLSAYFSPVNIRSPFSNANNNKSTIDTSISESKWYQSNVYTNSTTKSSTINVTTAIIFSNTTAIRECYTKQSAFGESYKYSRT